ncbi:MAG: response regulator [Fibrobacterales bacterium]
MSTQKRILIVDDTQSIHDDFRHTLTRLTHHTSAALELEKELFDEPSLDEQFQDFNYTIESAYQGLEAITMVHEAEKEGNPYCLIFMDVRMPPGIDGIETIYRIWEEFPHIEMAICSAYSDYSWTAIKERLQQTDKLVFLKKPFTKDTIIQTTYLLAKKWDTQHSSHDQIALLQQEVLERKKQIASIKIELDTITQHYKTTTFLKNNYMASVSQEIISPLNGILAVTDLLLDTSLDEEQKGLAQSIQNSSHSAYEKVSNLLEYQLLDTSHNTSEPVEFNIRALIENILELVQVTSEDKQITLTSSLHSSIPRNCKGEPVKIKQMLIQLLLNAIERTEQGRIDITINRNFTQDSITTTHLLFTVSDTGTVPSNEERAQFESNDIPEIGAHGYRIYLFKKILKTIEGNTPPKQQLESGTAYSFSIPITLLDNENLIAHSTSTQDTIQNLSCLIIGDNSTNRKILSLHLKHWGAKSTEVSSIEAGLEKIAVLRNSSEGYSMILLDFKDPSTAPYLDFAQLLQQLNSPTNPYKLIAIIPQGHKGDLIKFREAGYSAYLSKPIKQKQLFNCLMLLKLSMFNQLKLPNIITKYILDEYSMERFSMLIVESDIVSQRLLLYIFAEMRIICDIATTSEEAIEALQKKQYDLVACTNISPSISGVKIFEQTIQSRKNNQCRFIGITSHAEKLWGIFTEGTKVEGIIQKPFDKATITSMMKKIMSRE